MSIYKHLYGLLVSIAAFLVLVPWLYSCQQTPTGQGPVETDVSPGRKKGLTGIPPEALATVDDRQPGACKDDPMLGYFLWNLGTTEGGTVTPFQDDCTALMAFQGLPQKIRISYGKGRVEMPGPLGKVVSLRMSREALCPPPEDLISWEKVDLRRSELEDEPTWVQRTEAWCNSMKDLLARDPGLYFGVQDHDRIVPKASLFYLTREPWPGASGVLDSAIYRRIFSDADERKKLIEEQHEMGDHHGCDHN
jgi:hypothetical protein